MENQKQESTQVIIHKSDWANQFIKIGIFIFLLFALIKTNPTKQDFIKEVITVKLNSGENKLGKSIANAIGQFSYNTIGGLIEPFVIRKDFIIFSTYEIQFKYKDISINTSAFGILNYFLFDDKDKSSSTPSNNAFNNNINKTDSIKKETIEKSNVVINAETKKAEKKVDSKKIIIDAGNLERVDVAFGYYWNGEWYSKGWYTAYTNKPYTLTFPTGFNLKYIYWYANYPGGVWKEGATNEKYFCIKNSGPFDFKNQNNCNNKVGFTKQELNNEFNYMRFYSPSTIVPNNRPSTIVLPN